MVSCRPRIKEFRPFFRHCGCLLLRGGGSNLTRASVNGKYYNLLKVINVPEDKGSYGDFNDYGYYSSTSYAGYDNIPAGYWVYVYPDWYIWGNQK
ncbi:MAG: hypothetical protein JW765_06420 [Deltaproteobacteria bacterium]|nr:hypothetical protein [Candidatus Zymogenaceae bacterium]